LLSSNARVIKTKNAVIDVMTSRKNGPVNGGPRRGPVREIFSPSPKYILIGCREVPVEELSPELLRSTLAVRKQASYPPPVIGRA
jgi:hypothetical protein